MKNEYSNVAEGLAFTTLLCLIASLASPVGLILVVAFGVSAIISVVFSFIGGCSND